VVALQNNEEHGLASEYELFSHFTEERRNVAPLNAARMSIHHALDRWIQLRINLRIDASPIEF
jgi:hypothetical protein